MEEKSYEIVEAFISRYPGNDKTVFADNRLRRMDETYRGPAKKWKRFSTEEFTAFAEENEILPDTEIAIVQDGPDTFAVIQIIKF
jgi:hypothetical protein